MITTLRINITSHVAFVNIYIYIFDLCFLSVCIFVKNIYIYMLYIDLSYLNSLVAAQKIYIFYFVYSLKCLFSYPVLKKFLSFPEFFKELLLIFWISNSWCWLSLNSKYKFNKKSKIIPYFLRRILAAASICYCFSFIVIF